MRQASIVRPKSSERAAPQLGKPRVGGHREAARQPPPIGQHDRRLARRRFDPERRRFVEQLDRRLFGDFLEQRAPDRVIRHQDPERVRRRARRPEPQRYRRVRVQHACLAERGDLRRGNACPGAQGVQDGDGTVGQGDFAPVECGPRG
jgi:hypothetical protein